MDINAFVEECRAGGLSSLASTVRDMIMSGRLNPGDRLPTIRDMAKLLGLSAGTVANVWSQLRDESLIETRRRGGSFVLSPPTSEQVQPAANVTPFNLTQGVPDPALQPALGDALLAGLSRAAVDDQPGMISPDLVAAVRPTWPFAAEAWITAGGGTEGIYLALEAATRGHPIAVEDPTSPRMVEAIRTLGLTVFLVPWGKDGPDPAALERAIAAGAKAFVYQPRAHLPLGRHVSPDGLAALALLLSRHPEVTIVEDDGMGPLAERPLQGLGGAFPDRVVLVRAYCRAFGAQLKVCVIGGAQTLIQRIRQLRSHGSGTTSRILEGALAHLLKDRKAEIALRKARQQYAWRRSVFVTALRASDVAISDDGDGEGALLWLPVPDETLTLVRLSAAGIVVGPGSFCHAGSSKDQHICIGTTLPQSGSGNVQKIAKTIAATLRHASAADMWL